MSITELAVDRPDDLDTLDGLVLSDFSTDS